MYYGLFNPEVRIVGVVIFVGFRAVTLSKNFVQYPFNQEHISSWEIHIPVSMGAARGRLKRKDGIRFEVLPYSSTIKRLSK